MLMLKQRSSGLDELLSDLRFVRNRSTHVIFSVLFQLFVLIPIQCLPGGNQSVNGRETLLWNIYYQITASI